MIRDPRSPDENNLRLQDLPSLASEFGFKVEKLKSRTDDIKYKVGYSERHGFKYFGGTLGQSRISGHLRDTTNCYLLIFVGEGSVSIKQGKDDFVLDRIDNRLCFIDPSLETEYLIQDDVGFHGIYSQKENFERFLDRPISYYLNIPQYLTSPVAICYGKCLFA